MTAFPSDHSPPSGGDKTALRRWARARRATLDLPALSATLTARFARTPEFAAAHHVLLYLSTPEEIDVESLARDSDRSWYAPRCRPRGGLSLHRYIPSATPLIANRFGIREPSAETPRVDVAVINLIIVPGLLFTASGDRLGYGGGYYDRLLPGLSPSCVCAALVPDALLVDHLPTEPWDAAIDLIVTETRILRPNVRRVRYIELHVEDESGTLSAPHAS